MTRNKLISIVLSGALLLTVSLAPGRARADSGGGEDRPIRLYAAAYAGPIGTVAGAVVGGGLTINGREASAGQAVWAGDLVQSRAASRASLSLDSIGEVTLSRESSVRLATKPTTLNDGARGFVLIASLDRGDVGVNLQSAASAYLRIGNSAYSSSEGASFVASAREGRASIAVKYGRVSKEQQSNQHEYSIRPIGHGTNIEVKAGDLRKIQVQVIEDDKPVPGIAVQFALDTSSVVVGLLGMGSLSGTTASVVTGDDGIATVHFVARDAPGSSPISATIEGTRVSWTGTITVNGGHGVSHNTGWTIAALLGAGAAAGIAFALSREDKGTLQAQPPVVKNP